MSAKVGFTTSDQNRKRRAVSRWLLLGVFCLLVQILLGGITRLTGSGLSIAEWKPILGVFPPMNQTQWQQAFELYKQKASGQFLTQNADYTLSDFKAIYFWEWMHREWARVVLSGVFLAGFIFFSVRRYFDKSMVTPLAALFVLGALQGAVGWVMVASGLNPEDTHVSHIKLALHFMFALVLLCYTFWFALKLSVAEKDFVRSRGLRTLSVTMLFLLGVQLCYGAFMAGLKAAPAATSWPDINGSFFPQDIHHFGGNTYSGLSVFTDHPLVVHFVHRTLGYFVALCTMVFFAAALRQQAPALRRTATLGLMLVILQVALGIFTLANGMLMTQSKFRIFEWSAQLHQLTACFLLLNFVYNYYLLRKRSRR